MKKTLFFLKELFNKIFKSLELIRKIIINILFLGVIFFVLTLFNNEQVQTTQLVKPTTLFLKLNGDISEHQANKLNLLAINYIGSQNTNKIHLYSLIKVIRHAAKDPLINGLVLQLDSLNSISMAQLDYLGTVLKEFKLSKKPIYAISHSYTQTQYYLASFANKIFMNPYGNVQLKGFSSSQLYYNKLLNNLEITPHIFRVGTYKSFVEPFTRNNMSPLVKKDTKRWMNKIWDNYLTQIAINRNLKKASINLNTNQTLKILKDVNGDMAQMAIKLNLIDNLFHDYEIEKFLTTKLSRNSSNELRKIDYLKYKQLISLTPKSSDNNKIAVIVAEGEIVNDNNIPNSVNGQLTAKLLKQARLDKKTKAIVLLVNSPGGSVTASETIRAEILATRELTNKPIIVYMSGLAASGGYWISANATKIVANKNTITGSIGIFGLYFTIDKLLAKYGIYSDSVATNNLSTLNITQKMSPELEQIMQLNIEHGYNKFINIVSKSRGIALNKMSEIAEGRIWSGTEAKKLNLIDQIGNFDTAVNLAAKKAKIVKYDLVWMQTSANPLDKILSNFIESKIISNLLNNQSIVFLKNQLLTPKNKAKIMSDPLGAYSLCVNCAGFK